MHLSSFLQRVLCMNVILKATNARGNSIGGVRWLWALRVVGGCCTRNTAVTRNIVRNVRGCTSQNICSSGRCFY